MNKYLSSKIKIVSFICIIAVVFTHAYNWIDDFLQPITPITEGLNYSASIEYFISNGLVRFSVPIFFIISGYLFFRTFECSVKGYIYKLNSRFKSLIIPYFIWSFLSILLCDVLINLPILITLDWKEKRELGSLIPYIFAPPPFQFWFIIELFKYVIIAPVIYSIIKHTKLYIIIPIFLAWCIDYYVPGVNTEALLFFSVGSYLAIHKKEEIINYKFNKKIIGITSSAWIILLIVKTASAAIIGQNKAGNLLTLLIPYKICILLGVFTVWYGFDIIFEHESRSFSILNLSKHTFFIYAFHEPILNIVFQTILYKTGSSNIWNLIVYIGATILVIVLAIVLSSLLLKYLPKIHSILCGNRGSEKSEKIINNKISNNVQA